MLNYLNIIREIQSRGKVKIARDYKTTGIFDAQWSHDLSTGNFPFLTSRRLGPKSMAAELWCFIHGITSKRRFQEMGCSFWNEWSNPTRIPSHLQGEARKSAMLLEDDLGPIYGYQWRNFGEPYLPGRPVGEAVTSPSGGDQFAKVCADLRKNPDDRRMVVSAWSYCQLPQMALPPCHVLFNLVHYEGTLNLKWHQRSCDMVLGVPYNIACYSLLLILLARHANLQPGVVSGTLCDAHIYDGGTVDHREGLALQLTRETRELPRYEITETTRHNRQFPFDIFEWKPDNFKLLDYNPHPPIKFNVAV
jgi:thymidylate synthase